MMDEKDIVWAAGLIDGEGCIHIHKTKPNAKKGEINYKHCARLRVSMTHSLTVNKLFEIFGVGRVYSRAPQQAHHKQQYAWECSGEDAIFVIKQVVQYSITKKKEMNEFLRFEPLIRKNVSYMTGTPKEIVEQREEIYLNLQKIKKES